MGKRFKRRTKPIILIILICFVSINVFPYDIIGIMIENSKENAKLKNACLLIRKGYKERLDSLGEYEIVRESEEKEFYLLKRGGLTDGGIDSMYMELNGKDYNNIFMLDTPDYSGEFNIQKGKLHRAANRDLIINTTATVLLVTSTILGLAVTDSNGFAQTDNSERSNILLLAIPYAVLSGIAMFQSIRDVKIMNKKPKTAESIYNDFMRGAISKKPTSNNLIVWKTIGTSAVLTVYSGWIFDQYLNISERTTVLPLSNMGRKTIVSLEIFDYYLGLLLLNNIKVFEKDNKYFNLGISFEEY